MSHPDENRANDGGDDDDDEEEEEEKEGYGGSGVVQKERREKGYRRDFRKVKQVVLSPFRNAKKLILTRKKKNNDNKRSSSSSSSSGSGKRRVGCYLCFKQSPTLDSSPGDGEISDPNNPQFTFESLKALIEKNDFYSKECNPHIDINSSYSD